MARLQWTLQQLPAAERNYFFCLRVAGGDPSEAARLYEDQPASEVWRQYAHMAMYSRYTNHGR